MSFDGFELVKSLRTICVKLAHGWFVGLTESSRSSWCVLSSQTGTCRPSDASAVEPLLWFVGDGYDVVGGRELGCPDRGEVGRLRCFNWKERPRTDTGFAACLPGHDRARRKLCAAVLDSLCH
jgi:hypothetical protein